VSTRTRPKRSASVPPTTPPNADATRLNATTNGPSDSDKLSDAVIAGSA
jgi:hypothetical protein